MHWRWVTGARILGKLSVRACVCVFSLTRHRLTHCWRKPTANGVHKKYWLIYTHTHIHTQYTRFLSAPISAFKPLQNSRSQCCEADVRGRQWTRDQRRVQKGENGRQVYVTKLYPALKIIYIYLFILNYFLFSILLNTQTHKQEWCPYTDRVGKGRGSASVFDFTWTSNQKLFIIWFLRNQSGHKHRLIQTSEARKLGAQICSCCVDKDSEFYNNIFAGCIDWVDTLSSFLLCSKDGYLA